MKLRKALLLVLIVIVSVTLVLAGSGFFLLRGAPAWYRRSAFSAEAAATLENKLVVYYDRMAAAHAWQVRHASATRHSATAAATTSIAADPAMQPFDIQFSDAELNAFFDKWAGSNGRRESMDAYVHDPRLLLQPGKLVLAATVRDLGAVVSVELRPAIDDSGQLRLDISRAYAGMLPLPDAVWSSRRRQIENLLRRKLAEDQTWAQITPDGVANGAAAASAMKQLLLNALNGQPAEPVLFLPFDAMHPGKSVPVKLLSVSISDGSIAMRVREMDPAERAALLERLKEAVVNDHAESQ